MLLSWLHKAWKLLITASTILVAVLIAVALLLFGLMQLPQSKEFLAGELTREFNEQFEGSLQIGRIGGLLPFRINLHELQIDHPDSPDPALTVDRTVLSLRLWDLLQRRITIRSFELHVPVIRLQPDQEGVLTLEKAFRSRREGDARPVDFERGELRLYAPHMAIHDGVVTATGLRTGTERIRLPEEFTLSGIQARFFLELAPDHRLFDIEELAAGDPEGFPFRLRGQVFHDEEGLEFNGFRISAGDSRLEFSGDASRVNPFSPRFPEQLASAFFRLDVAETRLHGRELSRLMPKWPFPEQALEVELHAAGSLESLYFDRIDLWIDGSSLRLNLLLEELESERFAWSSVIESAVLQPDEFSQLLERYSGLHHEHLADPSAAPTAPSSAPTGRSPSEGSMATRALPETRLRGELSGSRTDLNLALSMEIGEGTLRTDGSISLQEEPVWQGSFRFDSLDLAPFFPGQLKESLATGEISLSGTGVDPDRHRVRFHTALGPGYADHLRFTSLFLQGEIENRRLRHTLVARNGPAELRSSGELQERNGEWELLLSGAMQHIDLNSLLREERFPATDLNLEYHADLRWSDPDDLAGRVNVDMAPSVVGGDSLRSHQFYADLNTPLRPGGDRTLRLTSSFLDAELHGALYPRNLARLARYWGTWLSDRVAEEITMQMNPETSPTVPLPAGEGPDPADLRLDLEFRDLQLLEGWFSHFPLTREWPDFSSNARLQLNLTADSEHLLLTGTLQDKAFHYRNLQAGPLRARITAGFSHTGRLTEDATLDLLLETEEAKYGSFRAGPSRLAATLVGETLRLEQRSRQIAGQVDLDLSLQARLDPGEIRILVEEFLLGSEQYAWAVRGQPEMLWTSEQRLHVENLVIASDVEQIEINGTWSTLPDDGVEYRIRNFRLERISDLIGGKVTFSGTVNGDFSTRSLTRIPVLDGTASIEQIMLNGRTVGDLQLSSSYSTEQNRFNTQVTVQTDPEKYGDYLAGNSGIGQDLVFTGYVTPPDRENPDQEFFYFDADLRQIDMWIVTVIVPGIVERMEGASSGRGYIRGSLTDYDFHSEFDIRDVRGSPVFMGVEYNINGRLIFDRFEGLVFDNLLLMDRQRGTGRLYGTVDLNNFSGQSDLDLALDFTDLLFMNNPYDPDVPFYATVRGSGQARISGPSTSPFLRSTRPIELSPDSRISVPVLDETELQQSSNFIQFVDTFDLEELREREEREAEGRRSGPDGSTELTFSERFTLDLQFIARNPVNFQLVFDRVTNEILTANGTGQIRINLADQNFSLFGRMNITSGNYQFVAGDIISRRFQLLEGGSIIWEGEPNNARLNVSATYRARPDLASLISTGLDRREGAQRSPVDLILNIGGTLSELENDFYFQVPSSIEGTLDPTLLAQINALNRNEEEKVIQATSILLSGNFIPLTSLSAEGGTGMALRESLTSGAVVVNPLITSQVINPLLSDQVNSLLRSDMALDIDFNLTQYNQVDLGVALRLYNDRLILRRDGQITGPYSDIGDLGATWRINRTFSITAFHRQDPSLTNASSPEPRQIQEMNGVGVEAQFRFNRWSELKDRFITFFNRLFGIRDEDEVEEERFASFN